MSNHPLVGTLAGLTLLISTLACATERKPWHNVTGPEDIDQAVRNAWGYQQPEYEDPLRFDRSTHISFPLPPLPGAAMSEHTIEGGIAREDINSEAAQAADQDIVVPLKLPPSTLPERQPGNSAPSHAGEAPRPAQTLRAISHIR